MVGVFKIIRDYTKVSLANRPIYIIMEE